MATVTSSRRRNERGSGSKKVAASTPKPRQTAVGNRGAQQGPLKPGTRTSGNPMVNSNTPAMRQIQAKASAARARTAGQPGIKGPITLPNSRRAGVNLPRTGAQVVKPPAGQMSPARIAALKAQGAAAKAGAQQRRANAATNEARRNAIRNQVATKNLQGLKAAASALGGARSLAFQAIAESVAPRPLASGTLADNKAKAAAAIAKKKAAMGPAMPARLRNAPKPPSLPARGKTMAQDFDNNFAAARKRGAKTFTWNGKKYTTKLRGEK